MSSNWVTTTRTFQTSSKLNGSTLGVGSATAAAYELNPIETDGLENSIFRISASKVVDDNLAPAFSDEGFDDEIGEDANRLNRMTEEFEASMQLSEEASRTSRTSLSDSSADEFRSEKSKEPRKAHLGRAPTVPHLRDLTVVDPFDPFRKGRRDQPSYKVVKGRAPQPPVTPTQQRSASLHRVVYSRSDKRPAPQPPVAAADQGGGAVGMRVRRVKRKNKARAQTVSPDSISLTFREKMAKFFGLTGGRKRAEKPRRTMSATFPSRSTEVLYGPSRYGSTKTLQSFSFAHSKIYSPRSNPEPFMDGGDVAIVQPQANGEVRVQKSQQGPVLKGHELRWTNRETVFDGGSPEQAWVRRADFQLRPHDNFDAHF